MARKKIWVFVAVIASATLFVFFIYALFFLGLNDFPWFLGVRLDQLSQLTYYSAALPILLVALTATGTAFWTGWTILTIKVAHPMPEITEKNDYARLKALFLCLAMFIVSGALVYGVYIRSFWAIALPALAISAVVFGAVFWVGVTIITTKVGLPTNKKQEESA